MRSLASLLLAILCIPWLIQASPVENPTADPTGSRLQASSNSTQEIVTWDGSSLFVHGKRVLIYSGEFHPFRLPSPGLWLDVFHKIKALGFNGVSFYTNWALLEGEPGHFRADGIFALDEFFAAATEAGIYLIARPGPYINAEVSGGGFPGWLQRTKGTLRTRDADYLNATKLYVSSISQIISKAQITNGGPVILLQFENEYTIAVQAQPALQRILADPTTTFTPELIAELKAGQDPDYMEIVKQMYREAGIVVPLTVNDLFPLGDWVPGSGPGASDIYGVDVYPFIFSSCAKGEWPSLDLTQVEILPMLHNMESPSAPYFTSEFQGGIFDPWGGSGLDQCAAFVNEDFERVIYKQLYGSQLSMINLYMTYGGTNWGNLGYPGGYTSYDYAAPITEDRLVSREKYSELKLQANFLKSSPAYLTAKPEGAKQGAHVNTSALTTSRVAGENSTSFYVVRHTYYANKNQTSYKLKVQTKNGNISIPQLGGSLLLNGRDSKVHLVDYALGDNITLAYSTAEVFTWTSTGSKTVLILYGGMGETHELAVPCDTGFLEQVEGGNVTQKVVSSNIVMKWQVSSTRRIVRLGNLVIHLLDRNAAYDYWSLDLIRHGTSKDASVIVKAGYLMRTAAIHGNSLFLVGDVNRTTTLEVVAAPDSVSDVYFNGRWLGIYHDEVKSIFQLDYHEPSLNLPDLSSLDWRYLDSLPEIQPGYNDKEWVACNNARSNNPRNLTTPMSLYASDYGFHSGSLLYRGHFTAIGSNSQNQTLSLITQGGSAFGHSAWLNETFVGSWTGSPTSASKNSSFTLPALQAGQPYVLTILIDHMGYDEESLGENTMKAPRGLLDYSLGIASTNTSMVWKMTGNFGGEQYVDFARGPLNEGAIFAERQGFHLPQAPTQDWPKHSPFNGTSGAGVAFYTTSFDLDIPAGYDVPLSFVFDNATDSVTGKPADFRAQLFVNGYQFGKYINNIGPQTRFPVPEGILNHNGKNYVALTIWSLSDAGAHLAGFKLAPQAVVQSGYTKPQLAPQPAYSPRLGAY